MAAVETLYSEPKPDLPSLTRIRRLSLPFEIVFAGFMALATLLVLTLASYAAFAGDHIRLAANGCELMLGTTNYPPGSIGFDELPPTARLVGAFIATCVYGSLMMALYSLYKLFGAYRQGIVFAASTMAWMRRAGYALVAWAVAPGLFQPLVHVMGLRDQQWFHGHTIAALLIGAALFVLAHVIALGREIEKEAEGYV